MSGVLLETRGAILAALDGLGMGQAEVLRTRKAIQKGAWSSGEILKKLNESAEEMNWQALRVGGYRVNAVDTTGIYRPRLKGCESKLYSSKAEKALAATTFGLLSRVGQCGEQKVSLPRVISRGEGKAQSEEGLMGRVCREGAAVIGEEDVFTADRKFPVILMLEAGLNKLVLRRASNFTMRRVFDPELAAALGKAKGRGRPRSQGELIRPLARVYKGKTIAASKADESYSWTDPEGNLLQAEVWRRVQLPPQKGWSQERKHLNAQQTWWVMTLKHPDFPIPMVIVSNVPLSPEQAYQVVRARWGVEQLPLVAKQLLGAHRLFVFEPEMCFRLPELTFVAAAILMLSAASCEPMPTGWWDTQPRPTAGRLRRHLHKVQDLLVLDLPSKLRKKNSSVAHLPIGWHPAIKKQPKIRET